MYDYWLKQTDKLLFPEIEWSKPERRDQSGKILIVGGSKNSFRAVALAYETALKTGAGQVKVFVPDTLRKVIPPIITDVIFAPSNTSGGFSLEAKNDLLAAAQWADSVLLIGDSDKNSETAVLLEDFIISADKPIIITRDAIDILMNSFGEILNKNNITLIASFAQTQKIFQTIYYPKILTFSMQLTNLVETLHKFTITYSIALSLLHVDNFIVANNGEVISTPLNSAVANGKINPLKIWSGEIPTKIAVYQIWVPNKKTAAITTAITSEY